MKKSFLKILLPLLLVLGIATAVTVVALAADGEERPDAMVEILADAEISAHKFGTYALADDGYIGIPVDFTFYHDDSFAVDPGINGTTLVMYVVNTYANRTGTDSDVSIIKSMLARGYIVAVADYHNHKKASGADLDWSVQKVNISLLAGRYFTQSAYKYEYEEAYVVPAGHNLTRDLVFYEYDKHATNGTLERIVEVWNDDFRGIKGSTYLIPWHNNGVRKEAQKGHDGSEPVWYSEGTGEGQVGYGGKTYVPDPENGLYLYVKHTKANEITDCVKPDGSPIDLNLYMLIIYPTNPEEEVPVMTLASSSQSIARSAYAQDRPHTNGFGFDGYGVAMFEYAYVPMARTDHYGYFGGNDIAQGAVTGSDGTYGVLNFNTAYIPTAALRYIRYLGLTEPETYKFSGNIGLIGISKSSQITHLADKELGYVKTVADGYTEEALEEYANSYLSTFGQLWYYYGHHGETRYDIGDTQSYTKNGATIDGGERQPWLTYNGAMIPSNAQFVYTSCGSTYLMIDENFGPFMTTAHIGGKENGYEENGYADNNYVINYAKVANVPFLGFELVIGHTLVGRTSNELGIDPYVAFKSFAHYFLNNSAPEVLYVTPLSGGEIGQSPVFTVKFAGTVSAEEIAKVTVTDKNGNLVLGTWESEFGKTEWSFTPSGALAGATEYTLSIPTSLKAENGKALANAFTATYYTEPADISTVSTDATVVTSTSGMTVTVTVPDLTAYASKNYNRIYLYVNVTNDAANTLRLYKDSQSGTLLGEIPLDGIGNYAIDITDALTALTPGETVTLYLKAGKTTATATPTGAAFSFEDFEDSSHKFSINNSLWTMGLTELEGHGKVIYASMTYHTNANVPTYRNYTRSGGLILYSLIPKIGAMDLGRRFTVTFDVYDTTSRMFSVGVGNLSSKSTGVVDYDSDNRNYTTKAGEWTTVTFEFDLQEPSYGTSGYSNKYLSLAIASTGDTELPIYFDNFRIVETTTDVEIGSVSLSITTAGGNGYKAPTSTEKPFMANGSAYATLAEAVSALGTAGGTVTLGANVTLTDSGVLTNINSASITLDLGGYAIRTKITSASLISPNTSTVKNITVKNGSIYLSGGALVGFEKSSTTTNVNVTLQNVYIGTELGATMRQLLVNNSASATSKVSLLLDECTVDMRERRFVKNPVEMLPTSGSKVTLCATFKGGSILLSRVDKTTMYSFVKDIYLVKGEGGYTNILLAEPRFFENTSIVTEDGFANIELNEGATAPNGYRSYVATISLYSTPYGIIPNEYADIEKYPIVLFNRDTLEFVMATNVLIDESVDNAAYGRLYYKGGNYAIYLRDDITYSKFANNLCFFMGDVVIDLGGHTLTYSTSMNFQAKYGNYTTSVNFKNGTVKANTTGALITAEVRSKASTFKFSFENITFTAVQGKNPAYLICQTKTTTNPNQTTITKTVTVKNCTFDMNAFTSNTTLFLIGHPDGIVKDTVTLIGSDIRGDASKLNLYTMNSTENSTFILQRGEDGNYITNTRLTTDPVPSKIIKTPEGEMSFIKAISTEGEYTTYALNADVFNTPYGRIPEEYEDITKYPVILFKGDGTFIKAGTLTELLSSQEWFWNTSTVAYLRSDTTVGYGSNFGHIAGTAVIDLNGHTLKATSTVFTNQFKSNLNKKSVNWTIKNGTINLNGQVLMKISENGSGTATGTYTFDGVTFEGVGTKNMIFEELTGNWTATLKFIFKGCTFRASGANPIYAAQNAAASANITVALEMIGGSFAFADGLESIPTFLTDPQNTGKKTLTFVRDADGLYTALCYKLGTQITDTKTFNTADGPLSFLADGTSSDGKYTVYRLKTADEEPSEPTPPPVNPLATPYGIIPDAYADEAVYPVVLFKGDGTFIKAGTLTELISSQEWFWNTNTVAYLRCDTTVGYGSNFGHITGTVVIDLNGHTLKATSTMFTNQLKSNLNGKSVHWTIKNGTVNLNSQVLMKISENGSGTATGTYTFEGVTFQNVGARALVLEDNAGNWTATLNFVFDDCTFYITGGTAFYSRKNADVSAKITASMQFLGGTFHYADALKTVNAAISDPAATGKKTVVFGKGTSGELTKFVAKSFENVSELTFPTENGALVLRRTAIAEGTSTYILSAYGFISTYLNLASDLNMVYRVFLPDGAVPAVTFTLNGKTVVAEPFGTDENGLYLFKLPSITPAMMGMTITATLTVDGERVDESTYSIKAYLGALKAKSEKDEALLALIDALLVYGAAAQQYEGQSAQDFVANIGNPASIPESENTVTLTGEESEIAKFVRFGMRLEGAFALRLTVRVTDTAGLVLVATSGDEVREFDLSERAAGDIVVLVDGITASELGESITFTFRKNGEQIGKTLTVTPNAYLYLASTTLQDANATTLAKAIYDYGKKASAYAK